MITRPPIFKWRQTESGLILCALRWYLRYSLSLRDVEDLLEGRGLNVSNPRVWRWVQYYGPELVFFNDTATTEIYTFSLHDALPVSDSWEAPRSPDPRPERRATNRARIR